MSKLEIREIKKEEYPILTDFLYHAIFLPVGVEPLPRKIIFEPEIFVYIENYGGKRLGYEITGERLDHANNEDFLMIKYLKSMRLAVLLLVYRQMRLFVLCG